MAAMGRILCRVPQTTISAACSPFSAFVVVRLRSRRNAACRDRCDGH
jgi:hypothetical protein